MVGQLMISRKSEMHYEAISVPELKVKEFKYLRIMNKNLLFISMMLFSCTLLLSQSTSSPYSYFGLGIEESPGTGVNRVLGGTGIGMKSNKFLNNINPASYSGIDSMSFIFELGLNAKITQYSYNSTTNKHIDANLNYLAMGMRPATWWAICLGITPYSSVGYKISGSGIVEGELSSYSKTYLGEGGISQLYFGNSFKLFKNLSVGINGSYLFGSIVHKEVIAGGNEIPQLILNKTFHANSLLLDYGLQYGIKHGKYQYTLGLIYGPSRHLKTSKTVDIDFDSDTIDLDNSGKENFYIPEKKGLGFSVERTNGLLFAFDYSTRGWSKTNYDNPLVRATDSQRFSAGFEYTTPKNYVNRGLSGWKYRLGGYYEKSGMIVKEHQLNKRSVSFGLGIPIKNELSMINISFEYGDFSAYSTNLMKETFYLMHLNFSLQDTWFMKRKYN
jgi:hypothetical protein